MQLTACIMSIAYLHQSLARQPPHAYKPPRDYVTNYDDVSKRVQLSGTLFLTGLPQLAPQQI